MFKIGDFSRLGQVSVRMLRHYDDLGLLKPSHVDQWTDYRYYTIEQLPRLNRILALKDLGIPLEKIADLLHHDMPLEQLKSLLCSKQAELNLEIQETQARINRLSARLDQLEHDGQNSDYDVIVKSVPACYLASARYIVPMVSDMPKYRGMLIEQLYSWLSKSKIKPIGYEIMLYHVSEYSETDIDMEFAIAIPESTKPITNQAETSIIMRQLPAAQVASVFHNGMVWDVTQAIAALFTWIGTNGYISSGEIREIHLFGSETRKVRDETVVMELQIPIIARQLASFDPLQSVDKTH
jgi:DNA-binding transcriptional MerR regulator